MGMGGAAKRLRLSCGASQLGDATGAGNAYAAVAAGAGGLAHRPGYHLAVLPLAGVRNGAIGPRHSALAVHLAIFPLAGVRAAIGESFSTRRATAGK